MVTPTAIVAYLALFVAVGFGFLFVNLLVGRFLRPDAPNVEKLEVYECGEPTIGSSFVQFDLRFYVVALLFIIFDVEIAFFFPWATVFGKAVQLSSADMAVHAELDPGDTADAAAGGAVTADNYRRAVRAKMLELGIDDPALASSTVVPEEEVRQSARNVALVAMADIAVFFAVLMVGFAYVWRRGDLDWVRAVSQERAAATRAPPLSHREPVLVP